ncbi:MAG: alcohol dehydrogenase catalytic domain-containing protein, partial [Candidatus Latescibacteria bacterium]|nr:alcohol dehydrogenase catalytic domain-containing protein [Candidatus Latescibacterota bacterium]
MRYNQRKYMLRKLGDTMESRGLFGKKFLDIQERKHQIGAPDEDHVIVKVHACGVCGTDVNFVRDWTDD